MVTATSYSKDSVQSKAPVSIKDLKIEPLNAQLYAKRNYFFANSENPHRARESVLEHYAPQRRFLGDFSLRAWEEAADRTIAIIQRVAQNPDTETVEISLSEELKKWKAEQFKAGRVLPPKGYGVKHASDACLDLLGIRGFPPELLTNDCVFGVGLMNMLPGAYDPKVLLSNYVCDSSFYYDHGYHRYFPNFAATIEEALNDSYARSTPGGASRRECNKLYLKYIRAKTAMEEENQAELTNRSSCTLTRDEATLLYFCDSSVGPLGAEAIQLGADPGAVVAQSAIAQLSHNVVDIGSDIEHSELFNSFLVTGDVRENGGLVNEEILRRTYDAYAALGARQWTSESHGPASHGGTILICWQMVNERHHWLRKIVLGYPKVRKQKGSLRQADIEEAFDEKFHTTGVSHPLENACNGETVCDQLKIFLQKHIRIQC